jgi:Ser/Thr protein kinase RdoA (MazF antagonist)
MNGFYQLTPDRILNTIEGLGYRLTGRTLQLNSYENRVFQLEIEPTDRDAIETEKIITKFYRPGRWTREQIQDEHDFLNELAGEGVPVVAPLCPQGGKQTLFQTHFEDEEIYFCVFPKMSGRLPQELGPRDLKAVGRRLAQIHNVGARKVALHRPNLDVETFGWASLDIISQSIWPELKKRYFDCASEILEVLERRLASATYLRIHGDCHRGNFLQTGKVLADNSPEYFFVDFDDFVNGPAAQDFWMLLDGDDEVGVEEMNAIMSGYEELRKWNREELDLMPALRALRLISYSCWIAKRWEDPSFPQLFPNFNTYLYWLEETDALERLLHAL